MSRIFTRNDGKIMYESDGATHRALFNIDINKGLLIKCPSAPVKITASYRRTATGWPPCTIGYDLRETWEKDILKITEGDK